MWRMLGVSALIDGWVVVEWVVERGVVCPCWCPLFMLIQQYRISHALTVPLWDLDALGFLPDQALQGGFRLESSITALPGRHMIGGGAYASEQCSQTNPTLMWIGVRTKASWCNNRHDILLFYDVLCFKSNLRRKQWLMKRARRSCYS